ncbi:MAG TPA: AsnC family transcriptional regulator [Microbacterium sp.]|uniref:AsnC family transcriptional regulator n=1 Tax=Microbacterium sp. TaxID=51671 RepID=UPI002B45C289|nr:AsnC family transcriptional regulator [Microbacterium sp.]HKT56921.1 AsnC family transcriptional regulator [Microbacterium sp.]
MALDEIDRRIVGALQVDGRASWRRIAGVIDVPVRTVVRRGNALLSSRAIRVGLVHSTRTVLLEVQAAAADVDAVARALAARETSIFVYVLGSPVRILVEEHEPAENADLMLHDIPSIPGVTGVALIPVLEYYRTLTSWMPGQLTPEEAQALNPAFGLPPRIDQPVPELDAGDEAILAALEADARAAAIDIAGSVGLSESAVRRRLGVLLGDVVEVRAIVAPATVGLPIAAFVWLRVRPGAVAAVSAGLQASPYVRYAAFTLSDEQILVDVAAPTVTELRRFLTESPWSADVDGMRAASVVAAYKRSGVRVQEA